MIFKSSFIRLLVLSIAQKLGFCFAEGVVGYRCKFMTVTSHRLVNIFVSMEEKYRNIKHMIKMRNDIG